MKVRSMDSPMSSVSFNRDMTCIACASSNGFGVFSTSPFSRLTWQASEDGGFNFVEMFDRTNFLLLVGAVQSPTGFSDCSAVLWDHSKGERLWEITVPSPIMGVCCSMGTIVISLEQRVVVYSISSDFNSVAFERSMETVYNPFGICAIGSQGGEHSAVACPGPRDGSIRVLIARGESAKRVGPGRAGRGERLVEKAHQKALSCLALNADGSLLASASQRGTLVRLWATSQTDNPTLLRELRRGTLDADIAHISFSMSSRLLCCASDAGTVHIFSLDPGPAGSGGGIAASMLARVQAGQRGFARYDLGERDASILCGVTDDRLYAVTSQGGLHEVSIDGEAGAEDRCMLQVYSKMSMEEEEEWVAETPSEESSGESSQSDSDE